MNTTDKVRRLRQHAIGTSGPSYMPHALRLYVLTHKELQKEIERYGYMFVYNQGAYCRPSFMGMGIILEHDGVDTLLESRPVMCVEMRSTNPFARTRYFDYEECFPSQGA